MFILLLLPQVNYLAIENYLVVFEDIVAFAKYLVFQTISNYHPILGK
jgi:ABC-type polysaccharide transport system permease subunit